MFLYVVDPIDQWSGWHQPADLFKAGSGGNEGDLHQAGDWHRLWEKAQALARRAGWDGDVRDGPYVTVLPNRPGEYWPGAVIIAWKQDTNGTTFVASEEFPLSWLGKPAVTG